MNYWNDDIYILALEIITLIPKFRTQMRGNIWKCQKYDTPTYFFSTSSLLLHQRDKQQEDDMLGKAFSVIKSWHFEIGAKWTIFMEINPWKFDKNNLPIHNSTINYSPFHFVSSPWKSGSNEWQVVVIWLVPWFPGKRRYACKYLLSIDLQYNALQKLQYTERVANVGISIRPE